MAVLFPSGYRPAARALVIDELDRALLVRFEFDDATVWATPGGGIEEGESVEQALRRELAEEVGLYDVEIGPHLWTRTVTAARPMGRWLGQCDVVHLVRTASFEPEPALSWEQLRSEFLHELRWWTLAELRELTESGALVAPRALVSIIEGVLLDGPPASPLLMER